MKKFLIAITIMLLMLAGCGNTNNQYSIKDGMSLDDIVGRVEENLIKTKSERLSDQIFGDILDIDLADIDDYCGVMSNNMMGGDAFIIVKTKHDKVDIIKEKLEAYRSSVISLQYLAAEVEKANLSKVYVKGDYVAYILLGNAFTIKFDQEKTQKCIDDAISIIDECIINK